MILPSVTESMAPIKFNRVVLLELMFNQSINSLTSISTFPVLQGLYLNLPVRKLLKHFQLFSNINLSHRLPQRVSVLRFAERIMLASIATNKVNSKPCIRSLTLKRV